MIFRNALLVSIAIIGLCHAADARATRGGSPSVTAGCPNPVDGGCAGANQNSIYKDATLFTTAQQSGQTSILPTHPMNFNVPGQDYPVGYDKTFILKDPQSNPPAGCVYQSTPQLLCNGTGSSITVDGYDFTGAISAVGIPLMLQFTGTFNAGTLATVSNNKFSAFSGGTNPPGNSTFFNFTGTGGAVYKFNEYLGQGILGPSAIYPITTGSGAAGFSTLDVEYNAFIDVNSARVINGSRSVDSRIFKYNLVNGMNPDSANPIHGEAELFAGLSGPWTITGVNNSNNFVIWKTATTQFIMGTTTFYASTGSTVGYKSLSTVFDNNVVVTNTSGSPATPLSPHLIGHALMAGGWASMGALHMANNYVDPVGATDCQLNGSTTQPDIATVSGNTATITSGAVMGEIGYNINGPGMTQATITNIAGSVYTFDGPTQTLGSINIVLTPGITSLTASNNINLLNGLDIGINGPTLTSVQCTGSHN